jgi:hypothetical protein
LSAKKDNSCIVEQMNTPTTQIVPEKKSVSGFHGRRATEMEQKKTARLARAVFR